jgi:periplasmic protein TonB
MTAIAAEDQSELRRWLLCGAVVIAMHAGLVFALVQWREPVDEGDYGSDAVVLELTPQQEQGIPTPDTPIEKVEEEKVDPLPQEESEVTLPAKPPEPQPVPQPQRDVAVDQATRAQQLAQIRTGIANWDTEIAKLLEHNKRYPAEARARGEEGVALLAFSIDRQGFVLSSRIVKSSGSAALDAETLALVKRAQPFPAPPAGRNDTEIKFTVPVHFSIR